MSESTFKKGDRVALIHLEDEIVYRHSVTRLERGTEGKVIHVDSLGTVHVKWDTGQTLGVCLDAGDDIELLSQGDE